MQQAYPYQAMAMVENRYRPLHMLGSNKYNVVMQAVDSERNAQVVLKVATQPCRSFESHAVGCYGLASEGAMLRLLRRRSLPVPAYIDSGHHEFSAYLAMQFVKGERLDVLAQQSELPLSVLVSLIDDVAGVLEHTHRLGYVHQDVKPVNILVTPRLRAVLIDWGSAMRLRPIGERSRYIAWTEGYVSLEQRQGSSIVGNDIYALGRTLEELAWKYIPHVQHIITRATAPLKYRYQTIKAMRVALRACIAPSLLS